MRDPATLTVLAVCLLLVCGIVALARRSPWRRGGGEVIVRCRDGHLFTTLWIPFISVKAIRLGPVRFQYCPVGDHATFVVPVDPDDLTDVERRFAALHHDRQIP